jgi:rhomboid family GlyGly-CTERM serine protease
MNASSVITTAARGPIPRAAGAELRAETLMFALLLGVLNLPLFIGGSTAPLAFQAEAVAAGEWWRLFTHPFVHVSWYHFLLDGAAFLCLYANLLAEQRWKRFAAVAASSAGSLLVAWGASPLIADHGLCGLSGAAHGLMAFSALETLAILKASRATRIIALVGLVAVVAKCVVEVATGGAFFTGLHFDLLGTPIVACHAGGVLGGIGAALGSGVLRPRNGMTGAAAR